MKIRDQLFKKAIRSRKPEDYAEFKLQRNRVVDLVRNAKRTYNDSLIEKINENNPSDKDWWKIIGSTLSNKHKKYDHVPAVIKGNDGEFKFEDTEKQML
jgi:hypothetical protein